MNKKTKNTGTLEDLKLEFFGKKGTKLRDELEEGYINFKISAMLQEQRLKQGLTQKELAVKVGSTASYISKIETSIKDVKISTLERIIKLGYGAELELNLKVS